MSYDSKTKDEILQELHAAQQRIAELEAREQSREAEATTVHAILEILPELMFRLAFDGTHLEFYAPNTDQLFVQPNDFLGKTVADVLPADIAETYMNAIQASLETGNKQLFEYQLDFSGKGRRYYEAYMVAAGGEVVVLVDDITARRHAEEAYTSLVEQSLLGLSILQDGKIVFANPRLAELSGYSTEELCAFTAQDVAEIIHPQDRARIMQRLSDRMAGKAISDRTEFRIVRSDGDMRWFEILAKTIIFAGRPAVQIEFLEISDRKQAEEALRDSESRNRALLNATRDEAMLIEPDGKVIALNQSAAAAFGRSIEEMVNVNILDMMPPQLAESRRAQGNRVVKTGEPVHFEDSRAGRHFANTVYPVFDEHGDVNLLAIFARDITRDRELEDHLQASERRYRDLFEFLPVTAIIHADYEVLMVNPACAQALGGTHNTTVQDFVGRPVWRFLHPSSRAHVEPRFRLLYEQRQATQPTEMIIVDDDGKPINMMVRGTPIVFDGEPAILSVFVDITEQKHAQEQILQLSDRFSALFHASPALLLMTDLETGRIVEVNAAFEQAFGFTRDELLGNKTTEVRLWPTHEDRNVFTGLLKNRGAVTNREFQLRVKSGEIRTFFGSANYLNFDRQMVILSAFIDVTDYKRMEREAQKARLLQVELDKEKELAALKDRFISVVSHEFRTPLSIIQSSSDNLSRYFDRMTVERRRRAFQQIHEQIAKLTEMTAGVLTLSGTQIGKTDFNPALIDIEAFCQTIFEQTQFTDDNNHQFAFYSDIGERPVMADANLLGHILTNLLNNAAKYTPANRSIMLELTRTDTEVIIKVIDEGIGIPEDDLARLFDPFHRASNVGDAAGSGLGLSIVKEYVELHGGTISVQSEVDKGSTFTVNLPVM